MSQKHQILSSQQFGSVADTHEEQGAANPQQQATNPEPEDVPGALDG